MKILKFIFCLCLILLTVLAGFDYQSTISQEVIPTFPALHDPDDPLLNEGKSKNTPWSGWWWPFYEKAPPNLYNPDGPMDKYDQVSINRGQPNPGAMSWEKEHHYTDKKSEGWFGHCNGWAAAAVLEAEPQNPKDVTEVHFEVNDIMGLLSEWHWFDSAVAFYGTRYYDENDNADDIFPHEFHRMIISYIGKQGLPIIMDISGGTSERSNPQVWNFPAFQYKLSYRPDKDNKEKTHVHCRLWFTDTTRPSALELKTFTEDYFYWIEGEKGNPTSGAWETAKEGGWGSSGDSRKKHPDFIWYPAVAKSHPILGHSQYLEIVGQGENR
ncbi:hypothetical protein [Dehalobacterium formicoaceticum]|uniref:Peptidase C1A papain C-terminal domain-containing protein n=1 Tax=Dehalobacterium formicoaceticum TaxID=51515 RepID=A0ABT1Y074_9FIRM|nr:hypothetical protein [Dehalobacterium formicoaceticum]MCR6544265.1 hypothetical protein [Dehalobacterium formicoaceticum]